MKYPNAWGNFFVFDRASWHHNKHMYIASTATTVKHMKHVKKKFPSTTINFPYNESYCG